MMKLNIQQGFIFLLTAFLLGGCGVFENEQAIDTTGTVFETWELEEIRYDNGEILTLAPDEPYWLELSEDSVLAEGEYHPSLVGQSFCNPCFGYFDYNEKIKASTSLLSVNA